MGKSVKALEDLQRVVKGGQEFLEKSKALPLEYVTEFVCPLLSAVLEPLCRLVA